VSVVSQQDVLPAVIQHADDSDRSRATCFASSSCSIQLCKSSISAAAGGAPQELVCDASSAALHPLQQQLLLKYVQCQSSTSTRLIWAAIRITADMLAAACSWEYRKSNGSRIY
jgi:hypothetical protein